MAPNYRILTEGIQNRINPEHLALRKEFSDELVTISYSDVLVYVRLAMKGVEPEYTQRSKDAGERVKEHLMSAISNISFRYQGSVMTNTHIKAHSDIDLLTIAGKFYTYDSYSATQAINEQAIKSTLTWAQVQKLNTEVNSPGYTGTVLDELRQLRLDCERVMLSKYSICDVTRPKAIKIKNLNLDREVDIVVANYYDDVTSIINDKGEYRGIQIYNKLAHAQEDKDYPFLSIKRINDRGNETSGRLKKMIRFLKNIKAKSTSNIILTSFDFNAICYEIDTSKYVYAKFYQLVPVLFTQLKSLCDNEWHSNSLMSVDGREPIFKNSPEKLQNLRIVFAELTSIFNDMIQAEVFK